MNRYQQSQDLLARGAEWIAGGVVSLNRKTEPAIAFTHARGSRLLDADGNSYIDYHAAFAPFILGHNDADVNAAVQAAMAKDWSLMGSGTTEWEIELAELLCSSVPSLDLVQITNTGSEATAHAIRLGRAATGRDDIIVTLGGYNGWHNDVARAVMPGVDAIGPRVSPGEYKFLPLSAGVPEDVRQRVHLVNFNDIASIEYVMARYPIAAVITEPVLQNVGIIEPQPGYLEALRAVCDRNGTVLIFDEVKTGFRASLGGYQAVAGVTPDLSVFGKAVANGYPLGVIGGKRELMELFDAPDASKKVLIAGTYNAHPFTSAAAIATIKKLSADDGAIYRQLEERTGQLVDGVSALFAEFGLTACTPRVGSAFCTYFADHEPADWHDILASCDAALDSRYRRALIDRGVYHFPAACKQGSVSAAHTAADVEETLSITREALQAIC
jgi:glutamate-1-semialdehyde 2,1-aminomutase